MTDNRSPLTIPDLLQMKARGERIVTLTSNDAVFARQFAGEQDVES